jgi:hypothetical protein
MNLASAISIYAFGTAEGAVKGWDTRGRGRAPRPPAKPRPFKTAPGKAGGYFKPGSIAARLYEDLAVNPGRWFSRKELREKYQVGGLLQALMQLQRAGVEKGKWDIEFRRNNGFVRLVPRIEHRQGEDSPIQSPKDKSQAEYNLFHMAIVKKDELGGGVTPSYKVKLEDGSVAVMKYPYNGVFGPARDNIPLKGEPEREAGAWQVAKVVGMQDLVPPTVVREVDGKAASLQLWTGGRQAEAAGNPFDGMQDRARVAAFDYVIGNEDRHKGNWLVDNEGKIHLIDHGLSFPQGQWNAKFNSKFVRRMAEQEDISEQYKPKVQGQVFSENQEKIVSALKGVGLGQDEIRGVKERIANMAAAKEWDDLPELKRRGIGRGQGRPWAKGGD